MSSTGAIQMTGLASGLDTTSIISQLMSLEQAPRTQIANRQVVAQARHDGLDDIKSKLTLLSTATQALSSVATWTDTQSVSTSDTTKATARRTGGAAAGGYELEVQRLASADQHTFAYAPPAADDTIQIGSTSVAIKAGATIDDAVAAINSSDTAGVYAVNVNGSMVLSSKTTGVSSAFTATGSSLTENLAAAKAGQDAAYTIDGVAHTSAKNVVANALPGVELTLNAKTTSPVTVQVSGPGVDADGVTSTVKAFISAYNTAVDAIRSRTTEKPVTNPTTQSQIATGALFGDTGLTDALSAMRSVLGNITGVGISTGSSSGAINPDSVSGKLTFDETAFRAALASSPSTVKATLGGSGTTGLAQKLGAVLSPQTQAGGILDTRENSETSQISDIKDRLDAFDARMTSKQDLLKKQFADLETVLSHNQSMQSSLVSMLGTSG